MKKLLIICGPTATGKTGLALRLAKVFNGEVISADSRQVYKGMDVGTGKDLPESVKFEKSNLKFKNKPILFCEIDGVRVWGYNLVDPKEEFSVSHYILIAEKIIDDVLKRGKLPILAGGTGLYIKGIVSGIPTSVIPSNKDLRLSLKDKSPDELSELLIGVDPIKAASMNSSDRKNPRRLVRAIEIAQFLAKDVLGKKNMKDFSTGGKRESKFTTLFIGLIAPRAILNGMIKKRVENRLNKGVEKEIRKLLADGIDWDTQSMQTLGYSEWRDFLSKKKTKKQVIDRWACDECKYAKRQITWFKKENKINWFDITSSGWETNVEKMVKKWHN